MKIMILESKDQVVNAAADMVEGLVRKRPACTLGLATGSTPVRLYEELARRFIAGRISFAQVSTFNLDEFIGFGRNHKWSYAHYMSEHFFSRVDLQATNTFLPTCLDVRDRRDVCERYEHEIRGRGGVDLQILGIGVNGHIGFNEPTSSLTSRTRVKTLTPQTVRDSGQSLQRDKAKPILAITMGIATILDSRRIVLLAMGGAKAPAVAAAVEGPVSAMCPASSLQFHRDVTVIADTDAAAELKYLEYYRSVHEIEKDLPTPASDAHICSTDASTGGVQ